MNYFIAFPFTNLIHSDTKVVDLKTKHFLQDIRLFVIKSGHNVFLAHHREQWGKQIMAHDQCTPSDFMEMKKADIVIAFPGDVPSGGVQIELGWASALGKKIYLLLNRNTQYSPLVYGLPTITDTTIVYYDNLYDEDLRRNIREMIEPIRGNLKWESER